MISALLRRAKKRDWVFAALTAFALAFLNCIHQNREVSLSEDPRFWQFAAVCFVSFASLGCVFLLERFWMAAPLIVAGGACIVLFAPEMRELYLYAALPAILTAFFLRYVPLAEKPDKWNVLANSVYPVLELTGEIWLMGKLTSSNVLYFRNFLPFTNLFGRFTDNHYGLIALIAVFGFLRERKTISVNMQKDSDRKKRGKKPRQKKLSGFAFVIWLRYTAVCLFFLFIIPAYSLFYVESFLPIPLFMNLTAVFVVAAQMVFDEATQKTCQEA